MSMPVRMPMSEGPRRFEVFTGEGRRRSFSATEKATIVAESWVGDVSVCTVARRHGLSPSQLFTWRRLARLRSVDEAPLFVPAVLAAAPEERARASKPAVASRLRRCRSGSAASIELEVGGVVVRVGRDAEAGTIAAVIGALRAGA